MKKQIVATLLALTMLSTMVAGCGSSGQETKESSITQAKESESTPAKSTTDAVKEEGIAVDAFAGTELTIVLTKNALSKCEDFNEMPGFKAAEEATGIHINWILLDPGSATEKVNLMLAGGNMPDAFIGSLSSSVVLSNMDLFYDLSEEGLLETYAPDVLEDYAQMVSVEDGLENLRLPDGSIRSLYTGVETTYANDAAGIMVMNGEWLDKLGMEIPTTADEFYEVLCAFRDNDMNGNGDPADEIPLTFANSTGLASFMNLANSWGIAGQWMDNADHYLQLEDGTVKSTMDTEECRAFLEFMHKLAEEGLLDIEGFSQTNDQYTAKWKEGLVGCSAGVWTAGDYIGEEEGEKYVAVRPFQALEGVEPVKTGRKNVTRFKQYGFVPTAQCSNIEALLHWWNFLSGSTEMKFTVRQGEEGGGWYQENGVYYAKTPDNLSADFSGANYSYTYGVVDFCPLILNGELLKPNPNEETDIRTTYVDTVWDMLQDDYFPTRVVPTEKSEEKTMITSELYTYIGNFVATSVINGITDESWNDYVSQLDAYGYYDLIQWYQDYYDGKF